MPFDYYNNLRPRQQAIYRRSDGVTEIDLPDAERLVGLVDRVRAALETEKARSVQQALARLDDALCSTLGVAPVSVKVLTRRPSRAGEELHGLYEREEGRRPLITVWMRTARHKRTVTFRTFLRTFLHELCHHLDYELLGLADTFHTEGFFKRESSLMRALVPPAPPRSRSAVEKPKPEPERAKKKPGPKPRQLKLEF
jgi:hypothetical protein